MRLCELDYITAAAVEIVYVETSVVSFLVAKPSRDALTSAHQIATQEWWNRRKPLFQCVTSDETMAECARGDAEWSRRRLAALAGMPVFAITSDVEKLAAELLATGALPLEARSDAIHLAVATTAKVDYLLTWNCRHLANAQILRRMEREAIRFGWKLPTVCTPLELMGSSPSEGEPNT